MQDLLSAKCNQAERLLTVWRHLVWEMQWSGTLISHSGDSLSERFFLVEFDLWECRETLWKQIIGNSIFQVDKWSPRKLLKHNKATIYLKNHMWLSHKRKVGYPFANPLLYWAIQISQWKMMELKKLLQFCSRFNFFNHHSLFVNNSWCRWKTIYPLCVSYTLSTKKVQRTFYETDIPISTPTFITIF